MSSYQINHFRKKKPELELSCRSQKGSLGAPQAIPTRVLKLRAPTSNIYINGTRPFYNILYLFYNDMYIQI